MKRVYVNEEWCLGCHLCEYICAFSNSGMTDMPTALKGKKIFPRIHIAGALSKKDGVICVDQQKCVGCLTCVLVCPFGALSPGENGIMQKCELCLENSGGEPACVKNCPNRAIVYEEREENA